MKITTVAIIGIIAAILAVQLKTMKAEYSIYITLGAGILIIYFMLTELGTIMDLVNKIQSYISINSTYLTILVKMLGITYITEIASGICKDAGQSSLGSQIEIFGKLAILAISMPVIVALLETVQSFLS